MTVGYLSKRLRVPFTAAGRKLWSNIMEILDEKDGVDTELLVYAMTLINKVGRQLFTPILLYVTVCFLFKCFLLKISDTFVNFFCLLTDVIGEKLRRLLVFQTLAGLLDQDSYYDMVDSLEEQGIEALGQRHLSRKGTDLDLVEQFNIYEVRKPFAGRSPNPAMKLRTATLCFALLPPA